MKKKNKYISETSVQDLIVQNSHNPEFLEAYEKEMLANEIAVSIHRLREKSKFSQAELAALTGTTQPMIARLESGKTTVNPTLNLLFRIAKATGKQLHISFK